jgi:secreted Zn-dependent insulinase-like peptidase
VYQDLIKAFPNRYEILDEAIKDMLHDVKDFEHEYVVLNGKIAYKDNDEYSTDVFMGYKTIFAYLHEFEKNKVNKATLDLNLFLGLKCGNFSYAEIVK